jgi:hypothetical protein
MKKNLPLILVVTLLIAVLAILKYRQTNSSYSQVDFKIEDINDIGSIEMSDKNGQKTSLKRTKDGWTVDDTVQAQHSKMILLLETINRLEVDLPVSDSMRKIAIEDLRMFGTKVQINDKNGDELKTIYIGNNTQDGNYMILSQNGVVGNEPYIVKLPGMQKIDLKHRFTARSDQWYSTEVFTVAVDKIKEIKVQFTEFPKFSFTLSKDEELIQINPLVDSIKINKPLHREHVLQFLLEFEMKHFEARLNSDSIIQIINTLKPHSTIEVTDVFDKKRSIILYRIPAELAPSGKDATGKDLPFNIEKYWAYVPQTKEYVIAQHYVFGPILQPYDYFFEVKK